MKIKTLENMSLHRQNKNGDFVYHVDFHFPGSANILPDKITVELSTEAGPGVFVATYDAEEKSSNCRASGEGLDIFVSLSRNPIGTGRMLIKVTTHVPFEGFSTNTQNICTKTTTNVILWDGPSDGAFTVEGTAITYPE